MPAPARDGRQTGVNRIAIAPAVERPVEVHLEDDRRTLDVILQPANGEQVRPEAEIRSAQRILRRVREGQSVQRRRRRRETIADFLRRAGDRIQQRQGHQHGKGDQPAPPPGARPRRQGGENGRQRQGRRQGEENPHLVVEFEDRVHAADVAGQHHVLDQQREQEAQRRHQRRQRAQHIMAPAHREEERGQQPKEKQGRQRLPGRRRHQQQIDHRQQDAGDGET